MKTRKKRIELKPVINPVTKNVEDMIPHVQIPKEDTRPMTTSKKVKELVLNPITTNDLMKAREGTHFKKDDIKTLIQEDTDVYAEEDGTKRLLAKFRKNVIPKPLLKLGWEAFYRTGYASRNRGPAAGPIDVNNSYWKRRKPTDVSKWSARYYQDGKKSLMRVNNNVFSVVLGYFDKTPFMSLPCRLTNYTQKYFEKYQQGIPFIQQLNTCFKTLVPDFHAAQLNRAKEQPHYQIKDTAFSSITLNRNFRTALHKDEGDYKEGFGNLAVLEYGEYEGGYTMFPRFGVGFDVRTGDFLAMDVHEWHCNTELVETTEQKKRNKELPVIYSDKKETGTLGLDKPYTRISFVCYLRENLIDCNYSATKEYYNRIHFNETQGFTNKQRNTRKNKNKNNKEI